VVVHREQGWSGIEGFKYLINCAQNPDILLCLEWEQPREPAPAGGGPRADNGNANIPNLLLAPAGGGTSETVCGCGRLAVIAVMGRLQLGALHDADEPLRDWSVNVESGLESWKELDENDLDVGCGCSAEIHQDFHQCHPPQGGCLPLP
jgi:hypothetical protein